MTHWLPLQVDLADLTIRGYRTNKQNTRKVLCLHGWLDNANSFQPMHSELSASDLVAIDLPGHGVSDHLHNNVPYTIASSMHYVLQVAAKLKWHEFHLIGHSLGGGIALLCAATAPQVTSLTMIDTIGPVSESADKLTNRLAKFHREMQSQSERTPKTFSSIESAVASRLKATTMQESSAQLIVQRHLKKVPNGWQWAFDPKLRVASPAYFTEPQVENILASVECPVLCIIAEQGYLVKNEHFDSRCGFIHNLNKCTLPGHHHLHMDDPTPVAQLVNNFWHKADC